MPSPPRDGQAGAALDWLADIGLPRQLQHAQAAWRERGAAVGGQAWLRLLPHVAWPVPEPEASFAARWTLAPDAGGWCGAWRCDGAAMPLASSTLSRVDLRFVLEAASAPERLLEEAARLLRPEGRLLVMGLNPFSPARLRWRGRGLVPWSRRRLVEVLEGLGLEVLQQAALGSRWRADAAVAGEGGARGPGRVAWAVLAVKRAPGMMPLRAGEARWRARSGVPAASGPPA